MRLTKLTIKTTQPFAMNIAPAANMVLNQGSQPLWFHCKMYDILCPVITLHPSPGFSFPNVGNPATNTITIVTGLPVANPYNFVVRCMIFSCPIITSLRTSSFSFSNVDNPAINTNNTITRLPTLTVSPCGVYDIFISHHHLSPNFQFLIFQCWQQKKLKKN